MAFVKTELIDWNGSGWIRMAMNRSDWLLIEQNGYGWNRLAIDRTEGLSIEHSYKY